MLDARNAAMGIWERHSDSSPRPGDTSGCFSSASQEESTTSEIQPIHLTSGRPRISLQDMITTSVALKSNLNIEVVKPSVPWSTALFSTTSPSQKHTSLPDDSVFLSDNDEIPSHVAQAISGLQREVLLLRNELNFELWLSRENVKHIGRLYQDRILSKNAEAERQGLVRIFTAFIQCAS